MAEELKGIEGAEHLEPEWGDRFRGWYRFVKPLRAETAPLGYEDLTYRFTICDHLYRFIIPAALDFEAGIITYSEAERLLGVFRYPRDEDGKFATPVTWNREKWEDIMKLTPDEIKKLIGKREVLSFEAFRIPQYGFEFLNITDNQFNEIEGLTNEPFTESLRAKYKEELDRRIHEIQDKIKGSPNYLFILLSTLNLRGPDPHEVSLMTNGILHT